MFDKSSIDRITELSAEVKELQHGGGTVHIKKDVPRYAGNGRTYPCSHPDWCC